jgi:hypothetical protein
MSAPQTPAGTPKRPTPDDLAGIPILISDDECERIASAPPSPATGSAKVRPTPDDLGGVMACPEGEEDSTIRPRRQR